MLCTSVCWQNENILQQMDDEKRGTWSSKLRFWEFLKVIALSFPSPYLDRINPLGSVWDKVDWLSWLPTHDPFQVLKNSNADSPVRTWNRREKSTSILANGICGFLLVPPTNSFQAKKNILKYVLCDEG